MKILRHFILAVCVFTMCNAAIAKRTSHHIYKGCTPTMKGAVDTKPKKVKSYNDMTRSEGGFDNPEIKKIILRGVVRDRNCVPISNVHVKLWQVDSYGQKRYVERFTTPQEKKAMNNKSYSKFDGTGSVTSTNNGEFFVITVMPSEFAKSKSAPKYINMQINHKDFPEVSNKLYLLEYGEFSKKKNNILAKNFSNTMSGNIPVYEFEIVLNGVSAHSRY